MEAAGRPRLGELLRQFRLDAGMTQQELAERAKLSADAVSTLERGTRTHPYRETVVLLARALDLSPEREALLASAAGTAYLPRRRSEALDASVLRIVHAEPQPKPRHNLPQQLTSFVGRQREVGEIAALLRDHRLVTVAGTGGVGKTRVALQIGSDVVCSTPDGVWLVDLAPLADQTLVANAVLAALQRPSTTVSSVDVVVAYLKTRSLLLILDNCEHVVGAARDLATGIAQGCPDVRVLATSRQGLAVAGEWIYRLPSLAVPPDSCLTARDALRYGAAALFVDRALVVATGFTLTDDNAPEVAEICRRLDGIPLAIELAAARVNVLAPRQIAHRLDDRFRLLTGGDARTLPRHQTMTALIDWSYDLLTAREQQFFESMSVFAGGCSLEAVTAVCAADGEDDVAVINLLQSLVTKSLVIAELAGNDQRYRLLESSRQYARDKLITSGEHEKLARRHALFYAELAEQLARAWDTMPDREWLPQAGIELENWRTAMEWALAKRRDVVLGQRMAAVRAIMWRSFTLAEGRRWVHAAQALVHEGTPAHLIAQLEQSEAEGARRFGEFKMALAAAQRALVQYRELSNAREIASAQIHVGAMLVVLERSAEAEPLLHEAFDVATTLGDRRLAAASLLHLGIARTYDRDFAAARATLAEALRLAKLLDAGLLVASVELALAENENLAGDSEAALRLIDDVLADYRSLNAPATLPSIAYALADKAAYLVALGRHDEARVHANEALELARDFQLVSVIVRSLRSLAVAALIRPQTRGRGENAGYTSAARVLGFVEARFATMGTPEHVEYEHYHSALAVLRDAIGGDEVPRLMANGATMTEDEAIAQAQALE